METEEPRHDFPTVQGQSQEDEEWGHDGNC